MHPFLLLCFSHFLADMVVNFSFFARAKRGDTLGKRLLGTGGHCLVHGVCVSVVLGLWGLPWLGPALGVFGLHFWVDWVRCRWEVRRFGANVLFFTRSQLLAALGSFGKGVSPEVRHKIGQWFLITGADQSAHLASLGVVYWVWLR